MDINDLKDALARAIAGDAALTTWCNSTYGKGHQVFISIDNRQPPSEDQCPMVILIPDAKNAGMVESKSHQFAVVSWVSGVDADGAARMRGHAGFTNITEYAGAHEVELMRQYVQAAIRKVDLGNGRIQMIDVNYDTVESFPMIGAFMLVSIDRSNIIGEDYLA